MKRLQFTITINAPAVLVHNTMLGLSNKSYYEQWTAEFNPTSSYEGTWEKGSEIKFVGVNEQGEKEGLLAKVVDHIPAKFVSLQYIGVVNGDQISTEGPEIEHWLHGFENYTFEEQQGSTLLTVDLDTTEEFGDYMSEAYPKAIARLKEICEASKLQ